MLNPRRSRCCNGTLHEQASVIGSEIRGRFQDLTLELRRHFLDVRGSTDSYYALQRLIIRIRRFCRDLEIREAEESELMWNVYHRDIGGVG